MITRVDLVADRIENPGNAQALVDSARMFGSHCLFRACGDFTTELIGAATSTEDVRPITDTELAAQYSPIVALDNLPRATSIYGFRLVEGPRPTMIVGNERWGIAHELESMAVQTVEIPLISRRLNCLNVAAAAAIGLYYLSRGGGGRLATRSAPARRRPELLLIGPSDHIEVGSSIRSACAFGWGRVFLEDREQKWFVRDRATRSEGRGAARRGRNSINVVPTKSDQRYAFDDVCVITTRILNRSGAPIYRANLADGHQQVIAIPDESRIDVKAVDWERLGRSVRFVHLDLPNQSFPYRYRLIASIALAEVARQVGRKIESRTTGRSDLRYGSSLDLLTETNGEVISLNELAVY
jgi:tRNA G18 (ribose-2'-O)-methylase SpoU